MKILLAGEKFLKEFPKAFENTRQEDIDNLLDKHVTSRNIAKETTTISPKCASVCTESPWVSRAPRPVVDFAADHPSPLGPTSSRPSSSAISGRSVVVIVPLLCALVLCGCHSKKVATHTTTQAITASQLSGRVASLENSEVFTGSIMQASYTHLVYSAPDSAGRQHLLSRTDLHIGRQDSALATTSVATHLTTEKTDTSSIRTDLTQSSETQAGAAIGSKTITHATERAKGLIRHIMLAACLVFLLILIIRHRRTILDILSYLIRTIRNR